jgi:hypothetical protein
MFFYSVEDVEVQYLGLSAKNTDLEDSDQVRHLIRWYMEYLFLGEFLSIRWLFGEMVITCV